MAQVRVLVLRAPGTNCDAETGYAFESVGGFVERLHINRLFEAPELLDEFQVFCVPGGFSYGDDVAAGRILANRLRGHLRDALERFRDKDRLILGICNGFQTLLKTGLLVEPEPETGQERATLAYNRHGRYEDRWVHLKVTPGRCVFVKAGETVTLPVAHAEGNFAVNRKETLDHLLAEERIVLRYVDGDGRPGPYPVNPNGSTGDVAGICDSTGRIFALMPHPERHVSPYQHPRWTRRRIQPTEGDGLRIFRNAIEYFG